MNNILNELKNNNKFKENSEYSCVYGKCDICKSNLRISGTKNKKKLLYLIEPGVNDICLGCLIKAYYF